MGMKILKIEVRTDNVLIEGYVNAVERDSLILPSIRGKFVERVVAGTFKKALLKNSDVELRFNHSKVLGSTANELQLKEDNIGLYARAIVTDAEVIEKAKNKELRGWSFGFVANSSEWEEYQEGIQRRYLKDIELKEVSILDKKPAYVATSLELRDEEESIIECRQMENDIETIVIKNEKSAEIRNFNANFFIAEKEIELLKIIGGID